MNELELEYEMCWMPKLAHCHQLKAHSQSKDGLTCTVATEGFGLLYIFSIHRIRSHTTSSIADR